MKITFNKGNCANIDNVDKMAFNLMTEYINNPSSKNSNNWHTLLLNNTIGSKFHFVANLFNIFSILNNTDEDISYEVIGVRDGNRDIALITIRLVGITSKIFATDKIELRLKAGEKDDKSIDDVYYTLVENFHKWDNMIKCLTNIGYQIDHKRNQLIIKDELIGPTLRLMKPKPCFEENHDMKNVYHTIYLYDYENVGMEFTKGEELYDLVKRLYDKYNTSKPKFIIKYFNSDHFDGYVHADNRLSYRIQPRFNKPTAFDSEDDANNYIKKMYDKLELLYDKYYTDKAKYGINFNYEKWKDNNIDGLGAARDIFMSSDSLGSIKFTVIESN